MEALQRLHNRGSISTGYEIDNSLKFEEDNLEAVYAQPTADGNQRTWTVSMWFKRTELGVSGAYNTLITALVGAETGSVYITPTDEIICDVGLGGTRNRQQTAMKFRDTSAWYHIVWRVDTTQGTAADRHRLYVNGVLQEWTTIDGYPDQNFQSNWNNNYPIYIGCYSTYNNYGFNGYIAEVHHTDGVSNAPTEFGEFDEDSGIWKPKAYTGSYGAQGFYLPFDDSSNLGTNAQGNDVNFTLQNITAADQATDTPTNNFCTLVGDQQFVPSKSTTLVREGGTIMHGGQNPGAYSTMGVRRGKWYFESTLLHLGGVGAENHGFGVIAADRLYDMNIAGEDIGADVGGWACAGNANPRNNNSGASGANYLTAPGINVVLGCALDMDNGKIWWHNAGTWHSLNSTVGNPANGTSPAWSNLLTATDDFVLPAAGLYANGAGPERAMNFGGYALPAFTAVGTYSDANGYGSFSYAPPSGYYALCTKNLEEFG